MNNPKRNAPDPILSHASLWPPRRTACRGLWAGRWRRPQPHPSLWGLHRPAARRFRGVLATAAAATGTGRVGECDLIGSVGVTAISLDDGLRARDYRP